MSEKIPETSWLADGVKAIEALTKRAQIVEPKFMSVPGEKPGTYAIVYPAPAGSPGPLAVKVAGPGWHNEVLSDVAQLGKFIIAKIEEEDIAVNPAIFICESGSLNFVYDSTDRRDKAGVCLEATQPWQWISAVQGSMTQAQIIRLLRITFDGCLDPDSGLISVLRQVKWGSSGQVESNIQRGKEALGKQIMNEASGVADFPDEFVLRVNVFKSWNRPMPVRMALEILPDVQRFELIPFPGQIHQAMQATLLSIQEELETSTKVPTFIGTV